MSGSSVLHMSIPSDKDYRKALIKEATDEALLSGFIQTAGRGARVERSDLQGEHLDELRAVVADVGRNLQEVGHVPRGMTYRGSLSVHVYTSETLKTAAFATVSELGSVDVSLADGALRELTSNTMEKYGRRAKRLRSGF